MPKANENSIQAQIVESDIWPSLPLESWQDTKDTLHMWMQVVGKIRLAQSPLINHRWEVPFYVTSRGLTTSPIPHGRRLFDIEFDFMDHRLVIRTSEGLTRIVPLVARPIAEFHAMVMEYLQELGTPVRIWTMPVEVENPIPFERDTAHRTYNPRHAHLFWRILMQSHRVFTEFRSAFLGKCSPVHFFWGSMDMAVTRFSGRPAPQHPGAPNVSLRVAREAYSHEVSSCGFWPGGGAIPEPSFYAYAYPEPEGYKNFGISPREACYSPDFREFILPYETVRLSDPPEKPLLRFLESTYEAAADLAGWDRLALERVPEHLI